MKNWTIKYINLGDIKLQIIVFYFANTISQYVNLLKICKFCNKVFIANNPKAKYDTP